MAAGRGIALTPGVHVGPVGRLLVAILNHYPRRASLSITSGYRPGRGSHHGGLTYKQSPTAALDIAGGGAARMRDVAKWLYGRFAKETVELIHTTPFASDRGFYVKNQRRHPGGGPYSPTTRREHRDHVHFATSKALALAILKKLEARKPAARAAGAATRSQVRAARAPETGKRSLSTRGARLIAEFEGLRRKLYNDPAGHCTIGIGHLVHRGACNGREPAEFKRGITTQRAYQLLKRDAKRMEAAVNGLGVPLNQNQFDALVSFTYNLGPGWTTQKTGIRDALRARRYRAVPREMRKWVKAGGRTLPGLVRRRKAEGRLFASGGGVPKPPKPAPRPPGVIKVADVQPGKTNPSVLVVQKALKRAVALDYSSGPRVFGPRTTKAYAAWQRRCRVPANGRPELKSLKMLGEKYGFKVKGSAAPPDKKRVPSPVPGRKVTTPYGKKGSWAAGYHTGDDYAAPPGTPVVAVRDGTIVWSKANNPSYGNWIGHRADNGRVYVYCHLSSRGVKLGQRVKAGQRIGRVGQTGRATGPHLHFEDHPPGPFEYGDDRRPKW
jgi:GH24 family phage-related lysozyme (muramidase)